MATQDRWLSVEEIAKHLGVSKESIYRWLERGKIPAHRVGKQWRFQVEEVNEWVRRGEASDDSAPKKPFNDERKEI
jgi:excisionase family DNA binding protein